jgi:hypothetical protein
MKVSVIATVLNEGEALRPLLDSLIQQSRLPDEIIICDGGSADHTLQILNEYKDWLPLHVIVVPGANISQGRNRAIAAASGEIIATTDAGVVLSPYWLEDLTRPIEAGETAVASGWFEPDSFTDFEVVMGATVLPERSDIDPATFLPSSRSIAFLKSAWAAVGGYPEWLDYSEDLVFDMRLREQFGPFAVCGYGRGLLPTARQLTRLLPPIFQLRPRRRQGQPVALASCRALFDLSGWSTRHFMVNLARKMVWMGAAVWRCERPTAAGRLNGCGTVPGAGAPPLACGRLA